MRVLLDENMPLDFGVLLPGHDVDHIETLGLKGTKNGALLELARDSYDAFVSLDRGILFQHRHHGNLIVLIVRVPNSNRESINERADAVCEALGSVHPGDVLEVPC